MRNRMSEMLALAISTHPRMSSQIQLLAGLNEGQWTREEVGEGLACGAPSLRKSPWNNEEQTSNSVQLPEQPN